MTHSQAKGSMTEEMNTNERKDVIKYLRAVCKHWGDNSWEDNLHVVDILDKHIFDYLNHEWASLSDIQKAIAQAREEGAREVIQIATMAFGKNHPNYKEFIKAVSLQKEEV